MTPKQKKQRQHNLEMLKLLGLTNDYSNYSETHIRKIIEAQKMRILNEWEQKATNGLEPTA